MLDRQVIGALQVAALRILSNGVVSAPTQAAMLLSGPNYTDKELARIMRMLANCLDQEEED